MSEFTKQELRILREALVISKNMFMLDDWQPYLAVLEKIREKEAAARG